MFNRINHKSTRKVNVTKYDHRGGKCYKIKHKVVICFNGIPHGWYM